MKYNLQQIMCRAWVLRRERSLTLCTALKIAWAEAKGEKVYTFNLEAERAAVSAYVMKLGRLIRSGLDDIHALHKYAILRAALLKSIDSVGVAVMDGKTVGLCKYAIRNAA
ncbi:MAG: hypothetical protein IKA94_05725 [Mogibacterium sp.]|nr:hypothetical protein [Mogibacterium sp.]